MRECYHLHVWERKVGLIMGRLSPTLTLVLAYVLIFPLEWKHLIWWLKIVQSHVKYRLNMLVSYFLQIVLCCLWCFADYNESITHMKPRYLCEKPHSTYIHWEVGRLNEFNCMCCTEKFELLDALFLKWFSHMYRCTVVRSVPHVGTIEIPSWRFLYLATSVTTCFLGTPSCQAGVVYYFSIFIPRKILSPKGT